MGRAYRYPPDVALYIFFTTNISTEYFKHADTLRFSLQNAVYFIMLPFLVHVLFTFCIQSMLKFKVCKSVHHRTIQINHQPDATVFQFIILTFVYSSTCFGRFPAHNQDSMTAVAASGFTFVSW
jgi:hypothetical protein